MKAKLGNDAIVSRATQSLKGLAKHLTANTEIPVAGQLMKVSAITAVFQGSLADREAVVSARGQYTAALATRKASEVDLRATDEALKQWVLNRFGPNSVEAHDFGYTTRKAAEPSAEAKAAAVLLRQATRKARGTRGKKEKQRIKGTLPDDAVQSTQS